MNNITGTFGINPDRSRRPSGCHPGINPLKRRLLRVHLNPGSVLDVGCGNGLYAFDCRDVCPDILQIDLEDCRDNRAQGFPFRAMDAEDLSVLDGPFDNIIAFDIIEHLNDDIHFLKSAHQLLNKKGKFFVSVPNEDNFLLEKLNLAHIHFTDKTHRREYSSENFRAKLEEAGFSMIEFLPQINHSIASVPQILQKCNLFSKGMAKLVSYQIRLLEMVGLFENRVVADWFGVLIK